MVRLREALSLARLREARWPMALQVLAALGALVVVVPRVVECITIELSTSIEVGKVDALTEIARDYNHADHRLGDRCIEVSVHGTTSGLAMQALRDGWSDTPGVDAPQPQVWMPTSSMWLSLLGEDRLFDGEPYERWQHQRDVPKITHSVEVIAMPQPMAEWLGWPDDPVDWDDIQVLAQQGWPPELREQWGEFTFRKDDPNLSTSGLAATAAAYYAGSGRTRDLRPEDLENNNIEELVRDVEGAVPYYHTEIITFLQELAAIDAADEPAALRFASAVVMQEQLVYEYNRGEYNLGEHGDEGEPPHNKLVALYPTDGLLSLDHPYVVLPSASDDQEAAADDFAAYLRRPEQQEQLTDVGFRQCQGVDDQGQPIDGVEVGECEGDLELPADTREDGLRPVVHADDLVEQPRPDTLRRMLEKWQGFSSEANILLVLDTSEDMAETSGGQTQLGAMQDAVTDALDELPAKHRLGLAIFPDQQQSGSQGQRDIYETLVPLGRLDEEHRDLVERRIDGLPDPHGSTPLYRTIRRLHEYMVVQAVPDEINAIVVLTNGEDHDRSGADTKEELERYLQDHVDDQTAAGERPVRIFSVAFDEDSAFFDVMKDISGVTSTPAYAAEDLSSLEAIFVDVFNSFGSRDPAVGS